MQSRYFTQRIVGLSLLLAGAAGCGGGNHSISGLQSNAREAANNVKGEQAFTGENLPSDDVAITSEISRSDSRAAGTGVKGIQAVYLAEWSQASCDAFLGTTKDSPNLKSVNIAFEPYIKDREVHSDPGQAGRQYSRAIYVVEKLLGQTKSVIVTVQFAFHAGGNDGNKDDPSDSEFKKRIDDFRDHFFRAYSGKVSFVLCPSLEDGWKNPADFQNRLTAIGGELFNDLTVDASSRINNATARRSSVIPNASAAASWTITGKKQR